MENLFNGKNETLSELSDIDQFCKDGIKFYDLFEIEINKPNEMFASTKETYTYSVDGDDLNFKYKYAIYAFIFEGVTIYNLSLVPMEESLRKETLNEILDWYSDDNENHSLLYKTFDYDVAIDLGLFRNIKEEGISKSVLNKIASAIPTIDKIKGFFLDYPQTANGLTGWDFLEEYINGAEHKC